MLDILKELAHVISWVVFFEDLVKLVGKLLLELVSTGRTSHLDVLVWCWVSILTTDRGLVSKSVFICVLNLNCSVDCELIAWLLVL